MGSKAIFTNDELLKVWTKIQQNFVFTSKICTEKEGDS